MIGMKAKWGGKWPLITSAIARVFTFPYCVYNYRAAFLRGGLMSSGKINHRRRTDLPSSPEMMSKTENQYNFSNISFGDSRLADVETWRQKIRVEVPFDTSKWSVVLFKELSLISRVAVVCFFKDDFLCIQTSTAAAIFWQHLCAVPFETNLLSRAAVAKTFYHAVNQHSFSILSVLHILIMSTAVF